MRCRYLVRLFLSRSSNPFTLLRTRSFPLLPALFCTVLLCGLPCFCGIVCAQADTTSKNSQPKTTAADQPTDSESTFSFLGVGKDAKIDPTRKSSFEEYILRPDHSCMGCWCSHAFGKRLNESLFDLNEKSTIFQNAWKNIQICLDKQYDAFPQIRSLQLQPKYSDTDYSTVVFYFSEQLDMPLAFTLTVRNPDKGLEELTRRFGPPDNVEDTWYIWQKNGDLLVYDSYDKKYKKKDFGIIYVYFLSALERHVAKVRLTTNLDLKQTKNEPAP